MPNWSSWPAVLTPWPPSSREVTEKGDAVKGLAIGRSGPGQRAATSREALEAKRLALDTLQKRTRNGLEHAWLGYGIARRAEAIGARRQQATQ